MGLRNPQLRSTDYPVVELPSQLGRGAHGWTAGYGKIVIVSEGAQLSRPKAARWNTNKLGFEEYSFLTLGRPENLSLRYQYDPILR
jgi:hypothetical protein